MEICSVFMSARHHTKRLLSPELLKWCAETEKFAFLKDTCCDLDQLEAKCKAVGAPD